MARTLISFSGGRTSAYMAHRMLREHDGSGEITVVFANTGQEHERTLAFVDQCDREWGLNVVWVEAVVNPEIGRGTTHRIVDFKTASRDGQPFEAMIAKYGIPNKPFPHCNRELKKRTIQSYAKSLGWKTNHYDTAIGIRADEIDRMSPRAEQERLIYPLVKWGVKKPAVLLWWQRQAFDLDLPEHLGNCVWCWKKTTRKHLTLALEAPEVFDFPARMEAAYAFAGPGEGPHRFFRGGWTTLDIKARARLPFQPFRDGHHEGDPTLDGHDGCVESCDAFGPETEQLSLFGESA
jgi:hypothetical protein